MVRGADPATTLMVTRPLDCKDFCSTLAIMQACAPQALRGRLAGVIAFPVTPFDAEGALDVDGLRANAAWLVDADHVSAVVAPSGTGELFALSPDECAAVTAATVEAVAGRVP